jgi:hypothetical protein
LEEVRMSQEKESEKRREEILQARQDFQRLSEMIRAGTEFSETVRVFGIDKQEHDIRVYAVSGKQFREALRSSKVPAVDIGNKEKLLENLDFMASLASAAARDPNLDDVLLPNEAAKIAIKAFELIGYTGAPKLASTSSSKR